LNATDSEVCSGHGACIAYNNCSCQSNFVTEHCTLPVCFGLNASDPLVCSERGYCLASDNCTCNNNTTGESCELNVCFGLNETDSLVCSKHGNCSAPGICNCTEGWTGLNCSIPICYGLNATDPLVCSGYGSCVLPDVCVCEDYTKHTGSNCEHFICYGKVDNETSVCGGSHWGRCTGGNHCSCNTGHKGKECATFSCYGVSHTNTSGVCSGNGTCSYNNHCDCDDGFVDFKCQYMECLSTNTSDDGQCSGHGSCNSPNVCTCDKGYFDYECQKHKCYDIPQNDSSVCSGHGTCSSLDNCDCDKGYSGSKCNVPICYNIRADKSPCNSWGNCIAPDTCKCYTDFIHGAECNYTDCPDLGDCHRHGLCTGIEDCTCNRGWNEPDCSTFNCNDRNLCNGNGDCVGPNDCRCYDGYGGDSCVPKCYDKLSTSKSVCDSHGECAAPDYCKCEDGYVKKDCSVAICFGIRGDDGSVCSGNGDCDITNDCDCDSHYFGGQCQFTTCNSVVNNDTNACSGRGSCIGYNKCTCNKGYTGSYCQRPVCNGIASNSDSVCNKRGTCVSLDKCSCQSGYSGNDCEITTCYGIISTDSQVCSGNGRCADGDSCKCRYGWTGDECNIPTCDGISSTSSKVCSKHGSCISADKCTCNAGYTGTFCQYPICFDRSSINATVCANNGECTAPNTCKCYDGYIGSDCSTKDPNVFTCFSKTKSDPRVCSKHGDCISKDVCRCNSGFSGSQCQYATCYGTRSDSRDVCSGHGACSALDTCDCFNGYTGNKCQNFACFGIGSSNSSTCSAQGTCVSADQCTCDKSGYQGDCSEFYCDGYVHQDVRVCSQRGNCVGPNTCKCGKHYYGAKCEYTTCFGVLQTDSGVCSGHGQCTQTDHCECEPGYMGSKCEVPTCYGIRSDSNAVCSSKGQCIALDKCDCRRDSAGGYYDGDRCDKCLTGYRTWPICKEKYCSAQTTCNSHGTCNSNLNCECFNNAQNGYWTGPYCSTCKTGYFGASCNAPCDKCNQHGTCDENGNCNCYNSAVAGYYDGLACGKCKDDVYGYPVCKTLIPGTFTFSDDGGKSDGKWKTPIPYMKCSDFIHPDDLPMLGEDPQCGYFGNNGGFTIIFGSNATVIPGNKVRFNLEFSNRNTTPYYYPVPFAAPDDPDEPKAVATSPDEISVCDGITIDGSTSSSKDGRPLTYAWTAIAGDNLDGLNDFLSDKTSMIIDIPDEKMPSGVTYKIQLTVTTFLGGVDTDTVTFKKLPYAVAIAEIYGLKTRTTVPSQFFRLDGIGIIGKCFYEDRTLTFSWRQTSGKALSPRSVSAGLLFDVGTFPARVATYKFELTVYPAANPDAKTVTTATVTVELSDLIAHIAGGDRKARNDQDLVLDASVSIDPDNSDETATYDWDCRNVNTNGFCPTQITSLLSDTQDAIVTYEGLKADKRLPAGKYLFSVVLKKGSRKASTSVTIEVVSENAPKVVFTNVPSAVVSPDDRTFVVPKIDGTYTSYQWSIDGNPVTNGEYESMLDDNLVKIIANEQRLIVGSDYYSLGSHTVRLDVYNDQDDAYAEYSFTVSLPPQRGLLTITPTSGDDTTEFTFVTTQWTSDNLPLTYQWAVYHKDSTKPITTTAKSVSNKFLFSNILPGLPANNYEMTVVVTVYDALGGASSRKGTVKVRPVGNPTNEETIQVMNDLAEKLNEMNTYGHNNRAVFLIDTLTQEIADRKNGSGGSRRRLDGSQSATDYSTLVDTLVSKIDTIHRSIDSMNPLDSTYFLQMGNSIENIVSTREYSDNSKQILVSLIEDLVVAAKNPIHTDLKFDENIAEPYISALTGILAASSGLDTRADTILTNMLLRMAPNSDGNIQTVAKPGITVSVGRYLSFELGKMQVNLPQLQNSAKLSSTSAVVFTEGLKAVLDVFNIEQADIHTRIYDPAVLNPKPYSNTNETILSSAIAVVEVRKTDGSYAIVNSVNDPVRLQITIPSSLNLQLLRNINDPLSAGFYPTCRYFSESKQKWIADSTCRVAQFTGLSVRCDCTHLTSFAVTYDYKGVPLPEPSPIPTPKPSPIHPKPTPVETSEEELTTENNRALRLGLGIGLGLGVPLVLISLIGTIASAIYIYMKYFNQYSDSGAGTKSNNDTNSYSGGTPNRSRREKLDDLRMFDDHSMIDIEMKSTPGNNSNEW
jgi:hypothetical protein